MLLDGGTDDLHGLIVGKHFPTLRLPEATLDFLDSLFCVIESIPQNHPQHLLWRSSGFFSQFFETGKLGFRNGNRGFQGNVPGSN